MTCQSYFFLFLFFFEMCACANMCVSCASALPWTLPVTTWLTCSKRKKPRRCCVRTSRLVCGTQDRYAYLPAAKIDQIYNGLASIEIHQDTLHKIHQDTPTAYRINVFRLEHHQTAACSFFQSKSLFIAGSWSKSFLAFFFLPQQPPTNTSRTAGPRHPQPAFSSTCLP